MKSLTPNWPETGGFHAAFPLARQTCYAPFAEDALKLLLTNLQRRTPRDVNKRCRNVLLKAFETGVFETGTGAEITVDFVRKMSLEELDREMG